MLAGSKCIWSGVGFVENGVFEVSVLIQRAFEQELLMAGQESLVFVIEFVCRREVLQSFLKET